MILEITTTCHILLSMSKNHTETDIFCHSEERLIYYLSKMKRKACIYVYNFNWQLYKDYICIYDNSNKNV